MKTEPQVLKEVIKVIKVRLQTNKGCFDGIATGRIDDAKGFSLKQVEGINYTLAHIECMLNSIEELEDSKLELLSVVSTSIRN